MGSQQIWQGPEWVLVRLVEKAMGTGPGRKVSGLHKRSLQQALLINAQDKSGLWGGIGLKKIRSLAKQHC